MLKILLLIADIQLDVKGCKDIYAALDRHIEAELISGYDTEEYGDTCQKKKKFMGMR